MIALQRMKKRTEIKCVTSRNSGRSLCLPSPCSFTDFFFRRLPFLESRRSHLIQLKITFNFWIKLGCIVYRPPNVGFFHELFDYLSQTVDTIVTNNTKSEFIVLGLDLTKHSTIFFPKYPGSYSNTISIHIGRSDH